MRVSTPAAASRSRELLCALTPDFLTLVPFFSCYKVNLSITAQGTE